MTNCLWCGKFTNKKLCSESCKEQYEKFSNLPKKKVYSYSEAGRYLGKDSRSVRKYEGQFYEIDKTLNPQKKLVSCKLCDTKVPTAKVRRGYCPKCTEKGLGRKEQGKQFAIKQTGSSNTNYRHGQSVNSRSTPEYRDWRSKVLEIHGDKCLISGFSEIDVHHIFPRGLFPEWKYEPWNGIPIARYLHLELHRSQLDVELLPSLYEYRQDAQQLTEELCRQLRSRRFHLLPEKTVDRLEMLRAAPKNYYKIALDLIPEFVQQELSHLEC